MFVNVTITSIFRSVFLCLLSLKVWPATTLLHINWLLCVCSRRTLTEQFPFGTLYAATGENVIFMGGEIEEMAPGSVRLTARHWSRRTGLLMDIPHIASSYLMYMTCALAWCLASCLLLSPWRFTLPYTMWPIETVPPEETPVTLCGFEDILELFSAVYHQAGVNARVRLCSLCIHR